MRRSVFLVFIAVTLFTGKLFSQNVDFEKKNFPNDKKG